MKVHSMRSDTLQTANTALKALLDLHGVPSRGTDILRAMEAPCLFLFREGRYIAGTAFLSPAWLNRYLLPQGFRLREHSLSRSDVRHFLADHTPAVLLLPQEQALTIRQADQRRILLLNSTMTWPTLLKKLPDALTALTLDPCTPEPQEVLPLLCESVRTLAAWRRELPAMLARTVTRQEMQPLHQQYFRALMTDLPPLAHLCPDNDLALLQLEMAHIYRHLFIIGENQVLLRDRLPLGMISHCTVYLQELILDRLHQLGAPDEIMDPLYREMR